MYNSKYLKLTSRFFLFYLDILGHLRKILPVADNSRRDAQTRTGFWLPAEVRDDCGASFSILAAEDEFRADNGLAEDRVGMVEEDAGTEGQYEGGTVAEQGADPGEEEGAGTEAEEVVGMKEQYDAGMMVREGMGTEGEDSRTEAREGAET
jgi:hypothetical protein